MNRTQMTLVGLLLLQIVLILLVRSPFASPSGEQQLRPLLPALESLSASRIELDGSAEAQLSLVKRGEGWTLDELGGYPADSEKIDGMLDSLRRIKVRRPVVSSSRYHETFNITDEANEGRIRIWDEGAGDPKIDLILGDSPNYRTTHVRLADEQAVYEAQDVGSADLRPDSAQWVRREFVDVEADQVVGMTLRNAEGVLELEQRDGQWFGSAGDQTDVALDADKVRQLIHAVTGLRLAKPVGTLDRDGQGIDPPAASVALRWQSAEGATDELELWIGKPLEEEASQRYVARSGFGFSAAVWESSVSELLEQNLDGLLASATPEVPTS